MTASSLPWTPEDVRTFLRAYGRTPQELRIEQLPSWWFNLVLRVEADGERLILRRYGVTPPEEVRWELTVLDHLHQHAFPTFTPLPRSDAADDALGTFLGKPAILYPFVEGGRGCELDWSLTMTQTAQAVARLHALTAGLPIPFPRIRSGTESRRLIQQTIEWTAQRGVAAHETVLQDLLRRAHHALAAFEERLAPYTEILPHSVVHHDAHCANVLFHDGKLVALIDFDDAYYGYQVADLAVMITNWAFDRRTHDRLELDKAMRVVRAYEQHRPLTPAERELLPDFVLFRLLCDGAEYVRGLLEQGSDASAAVEASTSYRAYLHHAQHPEWFAALQRELWGAEPFVPAP
jgi:homoserine kinase type II